MEVALFALLIALIVVGLTATVVLTRRRGDDTLEPAPLEAEAEVSGVGVATAEAEPELAAPLAPVRPSFRDRLAPSAAI